MPETFGDLSRESLGSIQFQTPRLDLPASSSSKDRLQINVSKDLKKVADQIIAAASLDSVRVWEECLLIWIGTFADQTVGEASPRFLPSKTGSELRILSQTYGVGVEALLRMGASFIAALMSQPELFESLKKSVGTSSSRSFSQELVARLRLADQVLKIAPKAIDASDLEGLKKQLGIRKT